MLKLATGLEERNGGLLMQWWNGDGAARVLPHNGDALLLEPAPPGRTLVELSRNGRDDEATRIACDVVVKLRVVSERRRR